MRIYSPYKIGLVLVFIGSPWLWIVFSGSEKISYSADLDVKETTTRSLDFTKKGYGFYTILIPNYAKHIVFVQILDPHGNVIDSKKIETKMSVNYFEFRYDRKYTMRVTNTSEKPVEIVIGFGDTKISELIVPMLLAFLGVGFIAFSGYRRMSSQSTAQPDENIS